jgi:6,7-dimethyl-8-ribityllumazine synthase
MAEYKTLTAHLNASGLKIGIIASRFNHMLVEKLVDGAMDALERHGAKLADQTVAWVPGAWEIPVVAQKMARSKRFDGIICIGAVIKGSTNHYEHVAGESVKGIAQVSLETSVPLTMGMLTTDTLAQAIERSGTTAGNQGFAAAMAVIELCNLVRQVE